MEEKDNKFIFKPQVGLGEILFSFNREEDVLRILGHSAERSVDIFNDNEYVIHLDYWDWYISISLYFEENKFDYLSMHTQDIILEDFRFSLYEQNEILSFIEKYHNTYKLDFIEKVESDKDMGEIWYFYENLGLTIWFDENEISDICVQKTRQIE